jgi:hypothetical protein
MLHDRKTEASKSPWAYNSILANRWLTNAWALVTDLLGGCSTTDPDPAANVVRSEADLNTRASRTYLVF